MPSDVERELVDWLIGAALDLTDEQTLFAGLCDRLSLAGVGITRAYLASEVLHPLIGARGFMWQGEGAVREDYGHDGIGVVDPNWRRSPFFHMLDRSLDRLHVRLDASLEPGRFPLLDRLKAQQANQYRAFRFDADGSIRAAFVFVRMDEAMRAMPATDLALLQAVQVIVLWGDAAFRDTPPLAMANGVAVLHPEVAALIRAAYDPVMPAVARDASHALRLAARM